LSPDYLDGRFFRVTLLTDDRFADAAMLVGDMTEAQIREAREFLQPLPAGAELADPVWFGEPPRLRLFGMAVTWIGFLLEAIVAALCLGVARAGSMSRHVALMIFCVTTYALAPVAGFGWLLSTMGIAQCGTAQRAARHAYVCVFFLILLYSEIPWTGLLRHWTS